MYKKYESVTEEDKDLLLQFSKLGVSDHKRWAIYLSLFASFIVSGFILLARFNVFDILSYKIFLYSVGFLIAIDLMFLVQTINNLKEAYTIRTIKEKVVFEGELLGFEGSDGDWIFKTGDEDWVCGYRSAVEKAKLATATLETLSPGEYVYGELTKNYGIFIKLEKIN